MSTDRSSLGFGGGRPGQVVLSDDHRALAESLASLPGVMVGVVTEGLVPLYSNQAAAEGFLGPGGRPSVYLDVPLDAFLPPAWVAEARRVMAELIVSGRPAIIRTLWRDRQALTWVTPLPAEGPGPRLFLVVARFVSGIDEKNVSASTDCLRIESRLVRLETLDVLSPRELEVLALLGKGLSVKEVAAMLHRAESTVERHRDSIHAKLGVHDRVGLAEIAARAGLKVDDAQRPRA